MPTYFTSIKKCLEDEELASLIRSEFKMSEDDARQSYFGCVRPLLERFKPTINLVIETHYIDKVYRDSYYNYYSSKLSRYKRNCIKISMFEAEVEIDDFRSPDKRDYLNEHYLGFWVLRPTEPQLIGRNVISPKALARNNVQICSARISSTANGLKLKARGFPHSSQDTETISCAETTIWALMEYFGSKYPEYKPVLPSQIHELLNYVSYQRLLPSSGLAVYQLSYALRELGFGTKIYSRDEHGDTFETLLGTYVESGIPIVIAMDNYKASRLNPQLGIKYIGHAVLCIGHETSYSKMIEGLMPWKLSYEELQQTAAVNEITLLDYNTMKRSYVFMDDNLPVYQLASLQAPANHYNSPHWKACNITHFIVPLYRKIYLEAGAARSFIAQFLINGPYPLAPNSQTVIRLFLCSTRTYRDYVSLNPTLSNEIKNLIVEEKLPKFIWVAELSSKELLKEKKADGVVILDATEPNLHYYAPLVLAFFNNNLLKYSIKKKTFEKLPLTLPPFLMCETNLKNI